MNKIRNFIDKVQSTFNHNGRTFAIVKDENGFTLVEVLGAIVVGSLIFAFAAFAIRGGIESSKVSAQNEALAYLRTNIQEGYATLHSYDGLDNDSAIAARLIPTNMMRGSEGDAYGDTIVSEFNGEITIESIDDGNNFQITIPNVPQGACIKLAHSAKNWEAMTINDTEVDRYSLVTEEICSDETDNTLVYQSR